jgi:RNA polymerase primary sigma factor
MTASLESSTPSDDLGPDPDPDRIDAEDPDSLLTPDEVVQLQRQIEAGLLARAARLDGPRPLDATDAELLVLEDLGEQARHRFIRANLRLVGMVARQFARRTQLPHADLFQEGCLGLITAVERFDYARGHRFSTYALFWIRAYIGSATARQFGAINLPTSRAEKLRSAHGVEARLAQQLGRVPSVSEVAAALGRSTEWTAELLAHQRPQSLELIEGSLLDRLPAGDELDPDHLAGNLEVRDLLRRLDPLSRQVLELRLGFVEAEPCSFTETARRLSISVTKVRRVQERALEYLRGICPQNAVNRL